MISFSIWFHFSVSSRKHTVAQKPEGNIYMRKVVLNKPYMRWKKEREKKLGLSKIDDVCLNKNPNMYETENKARTPLSV